MANRTYDRTVNKILRGQLDLSNVTAHAYLVQTAGTGTNYTPNLASHEYLSDVPVAARVAGPVTIPNFGIIGGASGRIVDGDDIVFPSVPQSTNPIEALIIVFDTGNPATSPLFMFVDDATGLPALPNGNNIPVTWNASGIWGVPRAN